MFLGRDQLPTAAFDAKELEVSHFVGTTKLMEYAAPVVVPPMLRLERRKDLETTLHNMKRTTHEKAYETGGAKTLEGRRCAAFI